MMIRFRRVDWEYKTPFRIAYQLSTHAQTVVVEIQEGDIVGRGEALGVSYRHETVDTIVEQLEDVAAELRNGISALELANRLPAGGARNALDCALWDLQAKRRRRRAWELAGIDRVRSLITTYTLGLDTPQVTMEAAAALREYSKLKLKLNGKDDLERVKLVRQVRPDAELVVDANQSWDERQLEVLVPQFASLGVQLIEQPLPPERDEFLSRFRSVVPLCADESCHVTESLDGLVGKYQYVNIKLDKTGGLTEALLLARRAKELGFKLMVGCMGGSSLSMAPAFIIGQVCEVVDLDGPLLTKSDVAHRIQYVGGEMPAPNVELWG